MPAVAPVYQRKQPDEQHTVQNQQKRNQPEHKRFDLIFKTFVNIVGIRLKNASNDDNARAINGIMHCRIKGMQTARFGVCIFTVTSMVRAAPNRDAMYPPANMSR